MLFPRPQSQLHWARNILPSEHELRSQAQLYSCGIREQRENAVLTIASRIKAGHNMIIAMTAIKLAALTG